ncbi:MAG TPA: hypothetical protein VGQ83_37345 [Polyangia bacterium]|jgi:hypothetical protein
MSRGARAALIAAVAAGAVAAGAVAAAKTLRCLPPPCQRGAPVKGCCTKPVCDYMAQIRMKMALQSVFVNAALTARSSSSDPAAQSRERQQFEDRLQRTIQNSAFKRQVFGDCEAELNGSVPNFETNASCQVMMNGQPASEDGAQERGSSCEEFTRAAYAHEDVHKAKCWSSGGTARSKQSLRDYAAEEVDGYQAEVESLVSQLESWARACSKAPDGKKAMEDARRLRQAMRSTEARRRAAAARGGR